MSTLNVNQINNAAGTGQPNIDGLAKAWVNFNGQGTVAIRASYNVSSITDNGTGDYTVNFATAMQDSNYAWAISHQRSGSGSNYAGFNATYYSNPNTTTSLRIPIYRNADPTDTLDTDWPTVCVLIFR